MKIFTISFAMVLAIAIGGCSNNEQITSSTLPAPIVSIDQVPTNLKGASNIQLNYSNQVVSPKYIVAVSLQYSADGTNFMPLASPSPGSTNYTLTIPHIDSTTAKFKIMAKDNRGFSTEQVSNTFNILSTPPLITVTTNNAVVSNDTSVTFGGTCKPGDAITYFPGLTPQTSAAMQAHYAKLTAPTCTAQGTWTFVVSESVLNDVFSYTLQQADVVGNSTQVSFTWTRTCLSTEYANGEVCTPQVCPPGTTGVDKIGCSNDGTRTRTCAINGSVWSAYTACTCSTGYIGTTCATCAAGFYASGPSCLPQVCTPSSMSSDTVACSMHGTRTEVCTTNGSGYGAWSNCACSAGYTGASCNSCASGYYQNASGSCVPQVCKPGSITSDNTACSLHGTRTETCTTDGSSLGTFGSCTCSAGYTGTNCASCASGYYQNASGSCVPQVCTPGSITSDNTGCDLHGTRTETCTANGSSVGTFGACACSAGYTGATCATCSTGYYQNSAGACVAEQCTPSAVNSDATGCSNHGNRSQSCASNGSAWGAFGACTCSVGYSGTDCSSCSTGYFLSGNSCLPDVCSPNTAQSDSAGCSNDGTRSRTCAANGSTWGAYSACVCATGYTGADCSSCSTGYNKIGNSCVANVCSPSSVQQDSAGCSNEGFRSRTCATDGTAWGAYTACTCSAGFTGANCSSCATGYHPVGNSCVANVCTPSSVQQDSTGCSSDGTRSRSCAVDGSAWGAYGACTCSTGYAGATCSSCAAGYYFNGTACVVEVCQPSVTQTDTTGCSNDGSRSRSCTSTGSAWSAYSSCTCDTGYNGSNCATCAAGYYFTGISCAIEQCSPSAVQTDITGCSSEGTRARSCTATGSNWNAWGACGCNVGWAGATCSACDKANGYAMVGNTCTQQVTINYSMTEASAQYYTDTVYVDANLSMSTNQGHSITTAYGNTPLTSWTITSGEVVTASCFGGAPWGNPWPTGRSPGDTMTIKDQNGNVIFNQFNGNQNVALTTSFTVAAGNIYTVDCHSSRAAACTCPTGYSVGSDTNSCVQTLIVPTTKAPNRQPIIIGDTDGRYYAEPGILADTANSALGPFSVMTADIGITGINGVNGTPVPFTKFAPTPFWINRVTSANRVSIKSTNDANNGWLTKAYCVNVATATNYVFHVGADNEWQIMIDGAPFASCTQGANADVYCYRGPQFLTSKLYAAKHTIELKYQNLTGSGAVWFEIFQNNLSDIQAATSISNLNLISSTASLQTGATWDYTGDACPAGYSLDVCNSNGNNQCVKQTQTTCN